MRSLSVSRQLTYLFASALALFLAGCPTEDDPFCGDFECQIGDGENATTCPQDCQPVCGDGACTGNETHAGCARDCPVECGDGSCDGAETSQSCPGDCPPPPVCGDGACEGGETANSCPGDCAVCTGNFPVDCHDGTGCWSSGTNCSSNVFTCGGSRRCASTNDWAYCCGGTFITCPGAAPYFCPQDGLCYPGNAIPGYCNVTGCSGILGDC